MDDLSHNPTLGLRLDRGMEVPLFRQISQGIRREILAGELKAGLNLPPERLLARALGVNRSTVLSAYRVLKDEGPTLPSLRALDSSGQALQVGSFSKTLCPGLRIGWLNGPASAIRQLAVARQTVDLHTATMNQWVVQRFLSEGLLTRHIEKIRPEYTARRNALLEALSPLARLGFSWTRPQGGYYVWCRLPDDIPLPRLDAEAAREGVAFLPGTVCSADGSTTRHLRLNFTALPPERLREGVARLFRALQAARSQHREGNIQGETHQPLI